MKKRNKTLLCIMLSAAVSASVFPNTYAAVKNVDMVVDDGTIINEIAPEMYGVNMEWATGVTAYGQIQNSDGSVSMRESFPKKYGNLLQFARKAGSSANVFKWKDSLGPISERPAQKLWGITAPVYAGIVEWLEMLYAATDHPRICYTVNISTDTYENMADLVEFLTSDGSVNYNGGVNWGEVRKSYGFENPVDIYCWEIGNEIDWHEGHIITAEEYVKRAAKAIDVIKSIDADGKISMHVSTAAHAAPDGWEEWHRPFLKEHGEKIDLISFHYYYPAGYVRRADVPLDIIENDIREITGSDRIKIYISEQAPAPNSYKYDKNAPYDYCLPHTIWGATSQAEFYLRNWLRPSVVATTCHSINSSVWSISYTTDDGETHFTATGEVMKTFKDYGVGKVYDTKLDSYSRDESSPIAGGMIEDKNGNVNLLFVNRNETDNVNVNFEFKNNSYRIKHIRRVHGDVKSADNWYRAGSTWEYNNPNKITVTDEDVIDGKNLVSYSFDPLSLYAIQLEKIPKTDEGLVEAKAGRFIAMGENLPYISEYADLKTSADYGNTSPICIDNTMYISSVMAQSIFGGDFSWNDAGNVCSANIGAVNVVFNIDEKTVSGADMPPAARIGEWTYFPLRAMAGLMGYTVYWNERGFVMLSQGDEDAVSADSTVTDYIYNRLIGG